MPDSKVRSSHLLGKDRQQQALRDQRAGAYDPVNEFGEPTPADKVRERGSAHQQAQPGADVRTEPVLSERDEPLPEGLRRRPKPPYSRTAGRRRS